jgi:hypothetical protein
VKLRKTIPSPDLFAGPFESLVPNGDVFVPGVPGLLAACTVSCPSLAIPL